VSECCLPFPHSKNKHQWNVNDFPSFTFDNQCAALSHHSKVNALICVIVKTVIGTLIASSTKSALTEDQRSLAMHLGKSNFDAVTLIYNRTLTHISRRKRFRKYHNLVLKISINSESKIVSLASRIMLKLSGNIDQYSLY